MLLGIKSGKRRGARANGIPLARSGKLQPPRPIRPHSSSPPPPHFRGHLELSGGRPPACPGRSGAPARLQGSTEARRVDGRRTRRSLRSVPPASAREIVSLLSSVQPAAGGWSAPTTPEGRGAETRSALDPGVGCLCLGQGAPGPLGSPSPGAVGRQRDHPPLRRLAPPLDPSAPPSPAPAAARLTPPAAPPSRAGRCGGWSPRSGALARTQTAARAQAAPGPAAP